MCCARGGRPKQVGLASSASQQLLSGARPEFLDRGCLRELLGLPGLEWQSLTAGLQRRNPVALWTTEIGAG